MNIGLGAKRRTILLVDADPHARAILRTALEAAGFSVGEAASAHEGERTALRIRPDAILADLIMDSARANMTFPERISATAAGIPCFIVSSAAAALFGSVGLHEIGVSGVFLKPVDTAIVIQTLKTRLAAEPRETGSA